MLVNVEPRNDYACKAVFGSQRHARVLLHLLNAVLAPCGLRVHNHGRGLDLASLPRQLRVAEVEEALPNGQGSDRPACGVLSGAGVFP